MDQMGRQYTSGPAPTLCALTRESLREGLATQVVMVTFTKKNGLIRQMYCTTYPGAIPLDQRPQVHEQFDVDATGLPMPVTIPDPGLFKVWDLEARGWRSFRYDSLLSVSVNHQRDYTDFR